MKTNRKILTLLLALIVLVQVFSISVFACSTEDEAASYVEGQLGKLKLAPGSGNAVPSGGNPVKATDEDIAGFPKEVFELVNKEREAAGLEPVYWDEDFAKCAQIRAEELKLKYSHMRPVTPSAGRDKWPVLSSGNEGYYNCPSVADEQGVEYTWIYENIVGQRKTPEAAMHAWMDSTGHRNNILDETHTRCGVGVVYTEEVAPSGYHWYWVIWLD